mmetsp:Transcript_61982/g.177793  ORF Transcript_61982/g.177793 Transcript_61982/m.177793 type:complete len:334 (+) Transcript_61982:5-1006(+)
MCVHTRACAIETVRATNSLQRRVTGATLTHIMSSRRWTLPGRTLLGDLSLCCRSRRRRAPCSAVKGRCRCRSAARATAREAAAGIELREEPGAELGGAPQGDTSAALVRSPEPLGLRLQDSGFAVQPQILGDELIPHDDRALKVLPQGDGLLPQARPLLGQLGAREALLGELASEGADADVELALQVLPRLQMRRGPVLGGPELPEGLGEAPLRVLEVLLHELELLLPGFGHLPLRLGVGAQSRPMHAELLLFALHGLALSCELPTCLVVGLAGRATLDGRATGGLGPIWAAGGRGGCCLVEGRLATLRQTLEQSCSRMSATTCTARRQRQLR